MNLHAQDVNSIPLKAMNEYGLDINVYNFEKYLLQRKLSELNTFKPIETTTISFKDTIVNRA